MMYRCLLSATVFTGAFVLSLQIRRNSIPAFRGDIGGFYAHAGEIVRMQWGDIHMESAGVVNIVAPIIRFGRVTAIG